jgi:hypothetical protein
MKTFTKWITSLFDTPSYGQRMEKYITSKNPTNIADVEYWASSFERGVQKGLI